MEEHALMFVEATPISPSGGLHPCMRGSHRLFRECTSPSNLKQRT